MACLLRSAHDQFRAGRSWPAAGLLSHMGKQLEIQGAHTNHSSPLRANGFATASTDEEASVLLHPE